MRIALCTVPRCSNPTREFVCRGCVEQLRKDLASIPALVAELNTTLARLDKLTPGNQPGGDTPLVHKPGAGEALWILTNTITTWTRILLEHNHLGVSLVLGHATAGVTVPDRITSSAARWLLANTASLALHPAAGEALDEIGDAVDHAYNAIDRPPDLLPAGRCGYLGCPAYLYAAPDALIVICRVCGSDHDMTTRRAWMTGEASDLHLTATVALSWVHLLMGKTIPGGTWRSWLSRGHIHHIDTDHVGRRLYRFGDVRDLAQEWVARPRRLKEGSAA